MSDANRAFYTLDCELRIVGASPNTLRIWGKPPKDIFGRKLVEAFPNVEGAPVHVAMEDALRSLHRSACGYIRRY